MRTKPYTYREFFNEIFKRLKAKNRIPEILDHIQAAGPIGEPDQELLNEEFDTIGTVSFGSCEGVYADMVIRYNGKDTIVGIAKCLDTSDEAMRTMGILAADYTAEARKFVEENMDDFDFVGYTLRMHPDKEYPRMTCSTLEKAMQRAREFGVREIRENRTRKMIPVKE